MRLTRQTSCLDGVVLVYFLRIGAGYSLNYLMKIFRLRLTATLLLERHQLLFLLSALLPTLQHCGAQMKRLSLKCPLSRARHLSEITCNDWAKFRNDSRQKI